MPQSASEVIEFLRANVDNPAELLPYLNSIEGHLPSEVGRMSFPEGNILHRMLFIVYHPELHWNSILALLAKLEPEVIETLMLMPNPEGEVPYQLILGFRAAIQNRYFEQFKQHEDAFFSAFMQYVNDKVLNILFEKYLSPKHFFLLAVLGAEWPQERIELVLSRLDQTVLKNALEKKNVDDTMLDIFSAIMGQPSYFALGLAVVNCLDLDILMALLHALGTGNTLDWILRNQSVVANAIIRKVFNSEHAHYLRFYTDVFCFFDEDNLRSFFALHPEVSVEQINEKKMTLVSRVKHRTKVASFRDRLNIAKNEVDEHIAFVLSTKDHLEQADFPKPLAHIVIEYLLEDVPKPIINRITVELNKSSVSTQVVSLQSIMRQLYQCFTHKEKFTSGIFRYNLIKEVLDYLVGPSDIKGWAFSEFERSFIALHEFKEKEASDKKLFAPLFSKMKTLRITSPLEKLTRCRKELEAFLKKKESGEKSYNKEEVFIKYRLEEKVAQANKEYQQERLEKMVEKWTKRAKRPFGSLLKEAQLIDQANTYGYQCKNVPDDGNCFFHAMVDQLAQKGLSFLGERQEILRARAMDYLINYLPEFQDFLDKHDGDMDEFIDRNVQDKTWADHLIMTALSRAINVTIVIVRSDGAVPTIFKQRDPIGILCIGYEVGQHYQSLVQEQNLRVTAPISLQDLIKEKKADGAEKDSASFQPLVKLRSA